MANRKTLKIAGVNFSLLTGKQAEALVDEYRYAERKGRIGIYSAYDKPSYSKVRAYEDCDAIRRELGGYTMYISGFNCCFFSLVYLLRANGHEYIVKETYANRFIAEVNFGALR